MTKIRKYTFRPRGRAVLVMGAAVATIALSLLAPGASAATTEEPGFTVEPVSTPLEPSYTVENFMHPNANEIAAATNILLKEGDGHIMQVTCEVQNNSQIKVDVDSDSHPDAPVCFQQTGNSGWLKMEIPGSYYVKAGAKVLTVTSIKNGVSSSPIDVPANKPANLITAVTDEVTLVELRVK